MKENNTSPPKEEEIDLGQLFNLIGRGFSKLFEFLKYIIDTFFKWILLFLLFLRSNTIKILIGTFIGLLLGGIYEYRYKIPTYESSMTVQPNFGSDVQLYKNIDYYQSLVLQSDFKRLAESLEIDEDEAKSLKLIEARPYSNEIRRSWLIRILSTN